MRYRRAIKVLIRYGFWENKMFNGIIGDRWMGEIDGRGCGIGCAGMWSCAHVVFDGGDSAWSPRRCRARGSRGPSAQSDRCVIWGTSGAHLGRPPRSAPPRRREYAPAPKAEKQWSPAAYPLGQLPTPAASARCALTFSRPCVPSSPRSWSCSCAPAFESANRPRRPRGAASLRGGCGVFATRVDPGGSNSAC